MDELVKRWFDEAVTDLEAAKILAEAGFDSRSIFHSQQAAEKAVKALFIAVKNVTPPKIHSIDKLGIDVAMPAELMDGAAHLSADYMPTRYPDIALPGSHLYNIEIAEARIEEARVIVDWVKRMIEVG